MSHQLSPTDFKNRIRELAEAAGVAKHVSLNQCWVDAHVRCPYGLPEGQYLHRPEGFCNDGCPTFYDNVCAPELGEDARAEVIREHFKEHQVSVISELGARADELPKGSPERLALELAADVISEKNMDRYILLENDLPEE